MILSRLQIMEMAIGNARELKVSRKDGCHEFAGFYRTRKDELLWISLCKAPIRNCASCGQPEDIGILHLECGQWTR